MGQPVGQRPVGVAGTAEPGPKCGHGHLLALESPPPAVVDESDVASDRCQAGVGIVGPQQQAVFRAGGEHPVRLGGSAGDEVVDHDGDVALIASHDDRLGTEDAPGGVDPGDPPLPGRLLVAAGAVDLAGEI